MFRVRQISFNYNSQQHFKGLRKISFDLGEGEVLAVIGRSGSGKSTLMKCLYGLEDLASGSIELDGEPVLGPSFNLIPGHPRMSLVSQEYYVLDNHTVQENFADKLIGYSSEDKSRRIRTLSRLLQLEKMLSMRARDLSSGQRQRVAIGRALAVFPAVLLLDEPFSNLDQILAAKLFSFIRKEATVHHTSVIMTTHHAEDALKHAHRMMVMEDGRCIQSGTPEQVFYEPSRPALAGLLGPGNLIPGDVFEPASRFSKAHKLFVRPDRLQVSRRPDLKVTVTDAVYNGKCWECQAESRSGFTVLFYAHERPEAQSRLGLKVIS